MMRALILSLAVFLLSCLAGAAIAQDSGTIKDSVYFTLDDGVMTHEEMEEEAEYVYGICAGNPYQSTYFNCQCLGGAFLIQREKLGPMIPQNRIFNTLTVSDKAVCPNTVSIAGESYQSCIRYATAYRELALDNEEYCNCVGNKVAKDFQKRPRLDISYIESIRLASMDYCDNPQNRPGKVKPRDPGLTK